MGQMIANAINGSVVNTAINFSFYFSWPSGSGIPTFVVDAPSSNEVGSSCRFVVVAAMMFAGLAAVP